ncbi:MAG: hypothetical protein ACQETQ_11715 [Spirochaetota bacterium]
MSHTTQRREAGQLARRSAIALALAATAAMVLGLLGCTVREDITVSVDGSGTTEVDIALDEVFIRYLRDLSGSVGGEEEELRIFDVEEIRRRFAERPGIEVLELSRGDPGELSLSLAFDDVAGLISEEETRFLSVEQGGDTSRLEITASREAVEEALTYSPLEGSSVSQMLMPPEDMGSEEYTEYLLWALEEYDDADTLRNKIESASIALHVEVDGEIVSQSGGRRDGETVRFEIPLVELLTLEEPERYAVEFR